jgi:tripartite-type tricarboxylate transporter receptor subunit TctC
MFPASLMLPGLGAVSAQNYPNKPIRMVTPGVSTVASAGLPGYELVTTISVFAPAGTPAHIIKFLNQEIVRVLNRPDVKGKAFNSGVEAAGSTPAQLAATMKSEMAQFGKMIKEAGIRAD